MSLLSYFHKCENVNTTSEHVSNRLHKVYLKLEEVFLKFSFVSKTRKVSIYLVLEHTTTFADTVVKSIPFLIDIPTAFVKPSIAR